MLVLFVLRKELGAAGQFRRSTSPLFLHRLLLDEGL